MAKRLTDTTKWNNPDFRSLPDKYKLLYLYLLDNCDSAGIVCIDLDLIGYTLNNKFPMEEVKSSLKEKVVFLSPKKIIIRNYIAFQNGDIFDSNSNIAKSVRAMLQTHGLLDRYKNGDFGVTQKFIASQ